MKKGERLRWDKHSLVIRSQLASVANVFPREFPPHTANMLHIVASDIAPSS